MPRTPQQHLSSTLHQTLPPHATQLSYRQLQSPQYHSTYLQRALKPSHPRLNHPIPLQAYTPQLITQTWPHLPCQLHRASPCSLHTPRQSQTRTLHQQQLHLQQTTRRRPRSPQLKGRLQAIRTMRTTTANRRPRPPPNAPPPQPHY